MLNLIRHHVAAAFALATLPHGVLAAQGTYSTSRRSPPRRTSPLTPTGVLAVAARRARKAAFRAHQTRFN